MSAQNGMSGRLALGLDFGTSSARALLVRVEDGEEIAEAVAPFEHGEDGVLLDPRDPHCARQDPRDYVTATERCVREALAGAVARGFRAEQVVGIGVDTTGSTPVPVAHDGTPLGWLDEFRGELDACAWLWKDHTAHAEAAEITDAARRAGLPYLSICGGTYSSEWYWSKILRCARTNPRVAPHIGAWVECCDLIPAWLAGDMRPASVRRSICAAGHKAMYDERWNGLPDERFLASLHPDLPRIRASFHAPAQTADQCAGRLAPERAAGLGLPQGIPIAVGAFDAHMGAVGAGCGAGTLVKIIGTSTCDCMVAPFDRAAPRMEIPGVCGIVPGSIAPGMLGIEAGQSAVGDIFAWFVRQFGGEHSGDAHARWSAEAARLAPGASGLLALDWHNGNRTVLVDPLLTGGVVGLTLATTPAELYRAWIEATAFGALAIIERLEEYGVRVERVVNCGGIATKSPLVMQIYADVCGRPMHVSASAQTCALGAAIFGATVAKAHPSFEHAQRAMAANHDRAYRPEPGAVATYRTLYRLYRTLHDGFGLGRADASLGRVMKELLSVRDAARTRAGAATGQGA